MIVTQKTPYRDGELRLGWASWDDGSLTARSIKYAYRDGSGKISRGAPEIPLDVLVDMLRYAAEQGELSFVPKAATRGHQTARQVLAERNGLATVHALLVQLRAELSWLDLEAVIRQVEARLEEMREHFLKKKA